MIDNEDKPEADTMKTLIRYLLETMIPVALSWLIIAIAASAVL